MRLLVIFTFDISLKTWYDGGILDREILIYKMMAQNGYKIGLLTYGDARDFEFKEGLGDIEIYPIYSYMKRPHKRLARLLYSLTIPFRLAGVFKGYDIYKSNQMLGSWVGLIAKLLYKKRFVARCGYEWLRNSVRESSGLKRYIIAFLGYFVELVIYSLSDRIIVSSVSILDFIKRAFRQPDSKLVHIPNFVDTDNFRRLDMDEYKERALYIGRINKIKNLENLIEAIGGCGAKTGLDIIGKREDTAELERFVKVKRLDVRFLGVIPNNELPAVINRYPVFTLVSHFENNPKSILEAMACERVVVANDAEGIKDLINDGISGILVSKDSAGIRNGLEKAFALSREGRSSVGSQAREYVIKNSSIKSVVKKEMDVYGGADRILI